MRIMYDGVTPTNLPASAAMVAGYINGPYAWTQAEWDRFPNAIKVQISVRAADRRGHVLDVESGANMPTPADAPPWVAARRAAGADPTVYCQASSLATVRAAFQSAKVAEPHYWIAKYDGDDTIPAGAVAKQWLNQPGYDRSSVADYWPGVDAPPAAAAASSNQEDLAMRVEAGTNVITAIPCDGKQQLFVQAGFGHAVDGHMWFVADTNSGSGKQYLGDGPLHVDSDRPGPITVPPWTRVVSLQTTCTVPFTAWCA